MRRRPLKKVGEILMEKGLITLEQLTRALGDQKRSGTSLGSSLVRLGFVDYRKLEETLSEELEKSENRKVGEILLEHRALSPADLAEAIKVQQATGKMLGEVLVEKGFVTAQQLFDALSIQFDIKEADLEAFVFRKEVVGLMPFGEIKRLKAIPLGMAGERLAVAVSEPFNRTLLQSVEALTHCALEPVFATPDAIERAIRRGFATAVSEEEDPSRIELPPEVRAKEQAARTAELLLSQAVTEGANFIHLEPAGDGLSVRYRVDGLLHPQSAVPPELAQSVVDYLKANCGLAVNNRRVIQSGYFTLTAGGADCQFKVSCFPVLMGYDQYKEKLTVKILRKTGENENLEDLGFFLAVLDRFTELLSLKSGVIIVAGPPDSGVSSTLYAALRKIKKDTLNTATVERSIESFIPGVAQTQIDASRGYSFREALASPLIEDADVLMVSDIEDSECAGLVFQAALSGRLVLTAVHARDAALVYPAIQEFGVEPVSAANTIKGVLAQRLVRRICGNCRESYVPSDELLSQLRLRFRTPFYRGRGCEACRFTGFRGRVGLFELLIPDDPLINSIATGLPAAEIRREAVNNGMITLRMDGVKKVLEGITTIEQVIGSALRE